MQKIPLGTEDFKKIIENHYYYVDKTKGIEGIVESSADVILFTRPRRFGKTLFLSTLNYFYNIENKDDNKLLFKDLYIAKSKAFSKQGMYPVISISLKDVSGTTFNDLISLLSHKLQVIIQEIQKNFKLDQIDKMELDKMIACDKNTLATALFTFAKLFYEHYNKKVIVLIDEYEAPLLNALEKGYVDQALDFFRVFYSSVLKSNPYLGRAVITGITRISQASIFSGLNNIIVEDITTNEFSDTFGFTQDEVNRALKHYNLEPDKKLIKEYYDGYHFGEYEIYNPWSIINYLHYKSIRSYWTETANYEIIYNLIQNADEDIKKKYISLAQGKAIFHTDIRYKNLKIKDLNNPERIFDFMITTGFLNYNEDKYELKVVNQEVLKSMPEITENGLFKVNKDYTNFKKAISEGNLALLEPSLNALIKDNYSYFDFPANTNESNYHVLLTTLLVLTGLGEIKSNQEAGLGRFDIALNSNNKMLYSYIIEVKRASKKEEINKLLNEGISQIKANNYLDFIKDKRRKGIICLCFYKKEVKIKFELYDE